MAKRKTATGREAPLKKKAPAEKGPEIDPDIKVTFGGAFLPPDESPDVAMFGGKSFHKLGRSDANPAGEEPSTPPAGAPSPATIGVDASWLPAVTEISDMVEEAASKLAIAEDELHQAKEKCKARQADYDGLVIRLRKVIRHEDVATKQQPMLPYGAEAASPKDETWRDVELEVLAISTGILTSLREAELNTIGDLADYTAADKRLIDIPGIGEGKAAKIDEALERFWEERKAAAEAGKLGSVDVDNDSGGAE